MISRIRRMMVLALIVVGFLSVMAPASALAAGSCDKANDKGFLGFPKWYKYLDVTADCSFEGVNFPEDIGKVLLAVFEILLRVGGIMAVIFVLYGSIQYILSQGEPENLKNARTTIINSLVGLSITMVATGIVNLIGGRIT